MTINQLSLLKTRRFLPLFLTQFFGAFNDNLYKNGLVILITYRLSTSTQIKTEVIITIASGIFILPFFLFSAIAGQVADKYEKSQLMRYTKLAEIIFMLLTAIGFYFNSIFLLMSVLFLVGTQATFFGPLKYSILPDHLADYELIAGNALLETGTYLAILSGTITGGVLAMFNLGIILISGSVVLVAMTGYLCSRWIPRAKIASPDIRIRYNLLIETKKIILYTMRDKHLAWPILGISWFWLVGATYLAQFPTYVKDVLGADSAIVTLFLTCFSLGIGIGSLLCNRLLKGKINAQYVPLAMLGMTLFSFDLVMASQYTELTSAQLLTLNQFLYHPQNWRILFDLLLLSICGGIYSVPLYTLLQKESNISHLSRVIAGNNIFNALFIVASVVITSVILYLHYSVTVVFGLVAIANLVVTLLTFYLYKYQT